MLRITSNIITFLILVTIIGLFTPIAAGEVNNPNPSLDSKMQQNRVMMTCYDKHDHLWLGQGVIFKVDEKGTYVVTAAHVAHDTEHCDGEFRDGSTHTLTTEKEFDKSDVAVMIAKGSHWKTSSHITALVMDSVIYDFGPPIVKVNRDKDGDLLGAHVSFSNTVYEGLAMARMPGVLFFYAGNRDNIVLTNLYSRPGSSGSGVFNTDGDLVGIVVAGTRIDPYITYIVDLNKSFEDEYKGDK